MSDGKDFRGGIPIEDDDSQPTREATVGARIYLGMIEGKAAYVTLSIELATRWAMVNKGGEVYECVDDSGTYSWTRVDMTGVC
jgi:hypothetical protein